MGPNNVSAAGGLLATRDADAGGGNRRGEATDGSSAVRGDGTASGARGGATLAVVATPAHVGEQVVRGSAELRGRVSALLGLLLMFMLFRFARCESGKKDMMRFAPATCLLCLSFLHAGIVAKGAAGDSAESKAKALRRTADRLMRDGELEQVRSPTRHCALGGQSLAFPLYGTAVHLFYCIL